MNRQELKQTITNGLVITLLVIILSAVDLALSGNFALNQETLNKVPITVFRSSVIVMAWTYAYVTAKELWRRRSVSYNKVREQLSIIKALISTHRLTKAFGTCIQGINEAKRLEIAKVKASKLKDKLDIKVAKIERKIKDFEFKSKSTKILKHRKQMVKDEIIKYNKILESIKDKPTEKLIFKLSREHKEITQANIWTQTTESFTKLDVSSSDRNFMLSKILRGVFTSSFTLIVIGGLVFEAGRTGRWEVWVLLILTIGLLVGNYVSGSYQGKKYILNNELITRMNALTIAQEFIDEHLPKQEIEIKEKTI